MENILNAIATAVARAIRNPGTGYVVIEWIPGKWSPSSGLSVVEVADYSKCPLAPHRVVTPEYRAVVNQDNTVSVTHS